MLGLGMVDGDRLLTLVFLVLLWASWLWMVCRTVSKDWARWREEAKITTKLEHLLKILEDKK